MLPAANVKLGTVGLFSYDKTESERKMVITKKSMIKRKFSDNSRPPIRSADDDGVFDFDGSQSPLINTWMLKFNWVLNSWEDKFDGR